MLTYQKQGYRSAQDEARKSHQSSGSDTETRLRGPVRKAVQRVPRHSTGLASRLLFVLIVLVMYI